MSSPDVPPPDQITKDVSVQSFVSAIVLTGAVALVYTGAFTILRKRFPLVYAPRTFLVPERYRSLPLTGWFSWAMLPLTMDDQAVIYRAGPDNWAAIYYMRKLFHLFVAVSIVGAIILFPTYATGNVGNKGLNLLTIGNVGDNQTARLWGTLILSWLFIAAVLYTIFKMMRTGAWLRHKYLLSPDQRESLSGYTLLVRDIPQNLRDPVALRNLFNRVQPNKVLDVVIVRDVSSISKTYKEHIKARDGLEKSISSYLSTVAKQYAKRMRQHSGNAIDLENGDGPTADTLANRPTHRKMFLLGEKVDTISHHIRTMHDAEEKLNTKRAQLYPSLERADSAAFVIFADLFAPHVAALANIHGTPGVMGDKQAGVDPEDVIWDNLDKKFVERQVRGFIASIALTALIVFWGVITAFLAGIASLDKLVGLAPFLSFVNDLPESVTGIIQGVLPTVAVAILFSLLPVILRFLSTFAGVMTSTAREKTLIQQYYAFLVFNVLLIVTISGSIFRTIDLILDHPASVFEILANTVPGVSTFFVNYIILLGLSGPAGELLQIANLILKPLLLRFMASTPRAIWRKSQPKVFLSGVPMAAHSFIATVGITYMTLAPLVPIMCVVYFGFYYLAYAYQMQYVYATKVQTGGWYLHSAAKQLFTALYIHEVVIGALFLLKKGWVQTGFIVLALLLTIAANRYANMYTSLMEAVPAKAALDEAKNMHLTMDSTVAKELVSNEPWKDEVVGIGATGRPSKATLTGLEAASASNEPDGVQNSEVEKYGGPDDYEKRFMHPALRPDPLTVWVPKDQLGVCERVIQPEVEEGCKPRFTWEGATMDKTGKIMVATEVIARDGEP